MQRKPGQKSNALAFPDLGHPAGRMQQAEKTLGEPGLTSFPISAIIETCPSPTRCWLPAPPTASPPWARSLVSGFFVSPRCPPDRHGGRRSPRGTRHPRFHPFPPSRKTETSRPRPCPPREHLSLVLRGHRCPARSHEFSL